MEGARSDVEVGGRGYRLREGMGERNRLRRRLL